MIVLVGIPGAGKTWISKSLFSSHIRVAFDQLPNRSKNDEDKLLIKSCKSGKDIVVDAANIDISKRKKYIRFAEEYEYTPYAVVIDTQLDLALARNDFRKRKVPEGAIRSYCEMMEWPTKQEGFKDVITLWDNWDPRK